MVRTPAALPPREPSGRESALRRSLVVLSFGGVVLVIGVSLTSASPLRTIQCDGSVPRWMLEAQDYDGSGCAEILPSGQEPENADWSYYCVGLCEVDWSH